MKKCSMCGKLKELDGFHNHPTGSHGKRSECRECYRAKRKQERKERGPKQETEEQKVRRRELHRARYARNPSYKAGMKKLRVATPKALLREHRRQMAEIYEHMRDCRVVSGQVLPQDVNGSKNNNWSN